MSSSFDVLCSVGGAGRYISYFKGAWKDQTWILALVAGTLIGGAIAATVLRSPAPVQVSEATEIQLNELGVVVPRTFEQGDGFIPIDHFNFEALLTLKGFLLMIVGGFLIGFGTRYAGGCTSGHAISGLSNLQLGSLIAVIGFFIGGLLMTHLIFPSLFSL
jgi:uncharacterized membrane protein YedE/YeeE